MKTGTSIDVFDPGVNTTSGQERLHDLRVALLGSQVYSSIASRRKGVDWILVLLYPVDNLLRSTCTKSEYNSEWHAFKTCLGRRPSLH